MSNKNKRMHVNYIYLVSVLCLVPTAIVDANILEDNNSRNIKRTKRYHYQQPQNWGAYYEPKYQPEYQEDTPYDYHYDYQYSSSFGHGYHHGKPDTQYGVPNPGLIPQHSGQILQSNYHQQHDFGYQNPSKKWGHHGGQSPYPHHPGYHYYPEHHYKHEFPCNHGPLIHPNNTNQQDIPNQNTQNPNPTWPNPDSVNIPNTATPNSNIDKELRPTTQTPQAESLVGPSLPTIGDKLGAFINSNILGTDFSEQNITIGPTGVLLQPDVGNNRVAVAQSVVISCDKPFASPKMPDFRSAGRRISDVRCYEYIWQLRVRNDQELWNERCKKDNNPRVSRSPSSRNRTRRQLLFGVSAFVGGFTAAPEQFPHMAALAWRGVNNDLVFKCGASLISANYVLTAAHCTSSGPDTRIIDPVPRIARVGGTYIGYQANGMAFTGSKRRRRQANMDQQDVNIINIIRHENYDPNRRYFDIALMELEYSLEFSKNLQPACLWTDINSSGRIRKAVGAGWGVLEANSNSISLNLQAGELDIIDVNTCDSLLQGSFSNNKFNGFADHQLCAGKLSGGVDVCQGDSGGPLQVKIQLPIKTQGSMHTILGVIASGVGCAKPDTPGVYTRVTSFVDWIEQRVWS